jgi:hypothetical protein
VGWFFVGETNSGPGCTVGFRFEAKQCETEEKFFSLRSETEGVVFACFAWKRNSEFHVRSKKEVKRNKAKETKQNKQNNNIFLSKIKGKQPLLRKR